MDCLAVTEGSVGSSGRRIRARFPGINLLRPRRPSRIRIGHHPRRTGPSSSGEVKAGPPAQRRRNRAASAPKPPWRRSSPGRRPVCRLRLLRSAEPVEKSSARATLSALRPSSSRRAGVQQAAPRQQLLGRGQPRAAQRAAQRPRAAQGRAGQLGDGAPPGARKGAPAPASGAPPAGAARPAPRTIVSSGPRFRCVPSASATRAAASASRRADDLAHAQQRQPKGVRRGAAREVRRGRPPPGAGRAREGGGSRPPRTPRRGSGSTNAIRPAPGAAAQPASSAQPRARRSVCEHAAGGLALHGAPQGVGARPGRRREGAGPPSVARVAKGVYAGRPVSLPPSLASAYLSNRYHMRFLPSIKAVVDTPCFISMSWARRCCGAPSGPVTGRAAYRRRIALLAILAVARRRPVGRERLIGLLWPEHPADAARHTLSESLYVLRKELGDGAFVAGGRRPGAQARGGRRRTWPRSRRRWRRGGWRMPWRRTAGRSWTASTCRTRRSSSTGWTASATGWRGRSRGRWRRWPRGRRRRGARWRRRSGGAGWPPTTRTARGWPCGWRRRWTPRASGPRRSAPCGTHAARVRAELGVEPESARAGLEQRLRTAPPAPPPSRHPLRPRPLRLRRVPADDAGDGGCGSDPATLEEAEGPVPADPEPPPGRGGRPCRRRRSRPRSRIASGRTGPTRPPRRRDGLRALAVHGGRWRPCCWCSRPRRCSRRWPAGRSADAAPPDRYDPRRIAVLYFDDQSPGGDLGYLAAGLTGELIDQLGGVAARWRWCRATASRRTATAR